MKKPIINALAFCLLLLLCINKSFAQKGGPDSSVSSYVESYVVNNYNKPSGQQSQLSNGVEYTPYSPSIKNNPYFHDLENVKQGTVSFDGFTYTRIPIMYDMYKDVLAVQLDNSPNKYALTSERVGSFDLDGHHFVYVSADTVANAGAFASGFYEQVYNGKTEALIRYTKSIRNQLVGNDTEACFTKVKSTYYIKVGNGYHEVNNEGDILSLFRDHKKEVQQYIKSNSIKFKETPAEAMVSVAGYYDQIKTL